MNTELHPDPWGDNSIQFPRLLAELQMADAIRDNLSEVCESMDLPLHRVHELLARAQTMWDDISSRTSADGLAPGKQDSRTVLAEHSDEQGWVAHDGWVDTGESFFVDAQLLLLLDFIDHSGAASTLKTYLAQRCES